MSYFQNNIELDKMVELRIEKKNIKNIMKNTDKIEESVIDILKEDKFIKFNKNGKDYIKLSVNKKFKDKCNRDEDFSHNYISDFLGKLFPEEDKEVIDIFSVMDFDGKYITLHF